LSEDIKLEENGLYRFWGVSIPLRGAPVVVMFRPTLDPMRPFPNLSEIAPDDTTHCILSDLPDPFKSNPWHLNVTKCLRRYYMVLTAANGSSRTDFRNYLGVSDDGINWFFDPDPLSVASGLPAAWDSASVYRSALVARQTNEKLYFDYYVTGLRVANEAPYHIARQVINFQSDSLPDKLD